MSKRTIYTIAVVFCVILAIKMWAWNPSAPVYWVLTAIIFTMYAVIFGVAIAN